MSDTATWTPPTGPVENKGHTAKDLNISIIVISTILFLHRVYVRAWSMKNWGADDYVATVAYALFMTLSAFEIEEVLHGAGKHIIDIDPKDLAVFFFNLPTMQLLYMATSYCIKLSILLFLRRFHKSQSWLRITWVVIVITTAQALIIFLMFALQCRPPKALWDKNLAKFTCMSADNQAKLFYAHAGAGIVIDLFCLVAPIIVIWSNLVGRTMKIKLTAVLGVAALAVICAAIRFSVIVTVDMGIDTTYNIRRASIWTNLECLFGFVVCCSPSMSPTIRFLRRKISGQSTSSKTSHGKPTNQIALSMQRSGQLQSSGMHHHGKGSGGEIPMYSVSHIAKTGSNDSDDNIPVDDGKMYNNLEFKVHVEKEVFTSKV